MEKTDLAPSNESISTDSADDYLGAYLEYNKVLRTWFVAYGVGGPALLLVNKSVVDMIKEPATLRCLVLAFALGVGAQVFGALLNKIANWRVYDSMRTTGGTAYKESAWYKFLGHFWVDIAIDAVTIVAFGYATWILLSLVVK